MSFLLSRERAFRVGLLIERALRRIGRCWARFQKDLIGLDPCLPLGTEAALLMGVTERPDLPKGDAD